MIKILGIFIRLVGFLLFILDLFFVNNIIAILSFAYVVLCIVALLFKKLDIITIKFSKNFIVNYSLFLPFFIGILWDFTNYVYTDFNPSFLFGLCIPYGLVYYLVRRNKMQIITNEDKIGVMDLIIKLFCLLAVVFLIGTSLEKVNYSTSKLKTVYHNVEITETHGGGFGSFDVVVNNESISFQMSAFDDFESGDTVDIHHYSNGILDSDIFLIP